MGMVTWEMVTWEMMIEERQPTSGESAFQLKRNHSGRTSAFPATITARDIMFIKSATIIINLVSDVYSVFGGFSL